jgi:hypothetical protein
MISSSTINAFLLISLFFVFKQFVALKVPSHAILRKKSFDIVLIAEVL